MNYRRDLHGLRNVDIRTKHKRNPEGGFWVEYATPGMTYINRLLVIRRLAAKYPEVLVVKKRHRRVRIFWFCRVTQLSFLEPEVRYE